MENLETFVDKLLEEKKEFKDLDPETINQIKSDLLGRVENRINATIVSNLPAGKIDEFNKLLESEKSDQEVQTFAEKNIPDLAQLIATELIVFRQTYLS